MQPKLSAILCLLLSSASVFAQQTSRVVKYHTNDIIPIRAKLHYTTMVQLPATEKIVGMATGDKDFWIIDAAGSYCFLHPAKAGLHSNLNLMTDKGGVYTFTLDEVQSGEPDLKVVIDPSDGTALTAANGSPRPVSAAEVAEAQAQVQAAQAHATQAIDQFRSEYPTKSLKFDYRYRDQHLFQVLAIYHDAQFTYIKSSAVEKFSIYELKDRKPNLVGFQLRDGTYVIPKVVDRAYLQIGKYKLNFERQAQ